MSRNGTKWQTSDASSHRRGRAFAQATTAVRSFRQDDRVIRVQLEENVSLAARTMVILEGVAERGPVTRTSEPSRARPVEQAGDVHRARQMDGMGAAAAAGRARAMG